MNVEKMTVKDFTTKYSQMKGEASQKALMTKIIKRRYCPVLDKKLMLDLMLEKSVQKQENGIEYIDMFLSKMNVIGAIIALYTNLIVEKNEQGHPDIFKAYDLLTQSGGLDAIYEAIGEREISELMTINGQVMDTFYAKHSAENYIANQIERIGILAGAVVGNALDTLVEVVNGEVGQMFLGKFDEMYKNITGRDFENAGIDLGELANLRDFREVE